MSFKIKNGVNVGYTTAELTSLTSGWGINEKGTIVYDKDLSKIKAWDGTQLVTVGGGGGGASQETQDFLVEAFVEPPVAVYPLAQEIGLNEYIAIPPFTSGTGWDEKLVTINVISGSLPNGVTIVTDPLSPLYSFIVGTATTAETGTIVIGVENPANEGEPFEYTLNWEVLEPQGVTEFTNSLDKYPSIRSNESDFDGINFSKVDNLLGSINSSYVFTDSTNNQVYYHFYPTPSEGYSYAYLMEHTTSSYWYMFKSNVAPADVVNGLDLADNLASTGYELASSDGEEVLVDGVVYPVDNSLTWITNQNYFNAGIDASLNGFLSSNTAWSYGFRLTEDIPGDFLGRVMFARESGNYYGWKAYNDTYEYVFYGKSVSNSGYSSMDSTIPTTITAGTWITVTHLSNNYTKFYVGAVEKNQATPWIYWNTDTLSDLQPLHFGKSINSNTDLGGFDNRYQGHSYWQGSIADLWIANGVEFNSTQVAEINGQTDITASSNYSSITHSWRLDEATGTSFANLKGGVDLTGVKST